MEIEFFKGQITVLTRNFGTNEYTADRIALIWSICKDLTNEAFEKIIRFYLETRSVRNPPVPADFRESAVQMRRHIEKRTEAPKLSHTGALERSPESEKLIKQFINKLGNGPRLNKGEE